MKMPFFSKFSAKFVYIAHCLRYTPFNFNQHHRDGKIKSFNVISIYVTSFQNTISHHHGSIHDNIITIILLEHNIIHAHVSRVSDSKKWLLSRQINRAIHDIKQYRPLKMCSQHTADFNSPCPWISNKNFSYNNINVQHTWVGYIMCTPSSYPIRRMVRGKLSSHKH